MSDLQRQIGENAQVRASAEASTDPPGARDADGFLRLKGTATGDNQLDPEPEPPRCTNLPGCPVHPEASPFHTHAADAARTYPMPPAEPQQAVTDAQYADEFRRIAESEAVTLASELRPAVEPPLLDLVRRFGIERYSLGYNVGQGDTAAATRDEGKASALYQQVVAVAPPYVQARDAEGEPLWVFGCGHVEASPRPPTFDHCTRSDAAPWRPLLVGGDPAPERCTAISGLHGTRCIYLVQDERHEANDDDRTRHEDENGFVWIAVRQGGDRAPEVDGQRLDVQRAWLHRELLAITAQRDEYASKLGEAHADLVEARAEVERLKAAQPDPLVLSLPEVHPLIVAAVGIDSERRYTRVGHLWRREFGEGGLALLVEMLDEEKPDGVRVELAPPREPRTWPKLDAEPELPSRVEVAGQGVYEREAGTRLYIHERDGGSTWSLHELRELGDVTEVTE